MVAQHYRWDFIGLSTDTKPTPETSPKVVDGSTFYCSDTSKLYVFCKDTWYEKTVSGGGGGTTYTAGEGIDITGNVISSSEILTLNYADYNPNDDMEPVKIFPEWLLENGVKAGQLLRIKPASEEVAQPMFFNMGVDENGNPAYREYDAVIPAAIFTVSLNNMIEVNDSYQYLTLTQFSQANDTTFDNLWGWEIDRTDTPTVYTFIGYRFLGTDSNVIELNSSMYNYHETGDYDDGIALWLLKPGYYAAPGGDKIYIHSTASTTDRKNFLISASNGTNKVITEINQNSIVGYRVDDADGILSSSDTFYVATTTTGNSNQLVMTQNATTSMVYADAVNKTKVKIGGNITGNYGVQIGYVGTENGDRSVSIGHMGSGNSADSVNIGESSRVEYGAPYSVALGSYSYTTMQGQVDISTLKSTNTYGYNNSQYRLLTGLYDGQSNHDAATVAQGNKLMTTAPATTDAGVLGQLWTDTTAMHTYQVTAIDTTDPDNPVYTWSQRW
ncbi:MAG: hypothetical protein J6S85_18340 [Methanobrevibacter sp.]|nr:hypothetical protein [Methanobrevibacter sp.]